MVVVGASLVGITWLPWSPQDGCPSVLFDGLYFKVNDDFVLPNRNVIASVIFSPEPITSPTDSVWFVRADNEMKISFFLVPATNGVIRQLPKVHPPNIM